MSPFNWSVDPVEIISQFETRHSNPEAGALFLFAVWTVDSLYYLQDLDETHDLLQSTVAGHRPDVVEVAHSRWATGTCVTALDLCAAGLGRAFCAYTGNREPAVSYFDPNPKGKKANNLANKLRPLLPPDALQWVDAVLADPRYKQIIAARHALTHARVLRHFTIPRQRLQVQVENDRLDVPTLINYAKDVGTKHVLALLAILPKI